MTSHTGLPPSSELDARYAISFEVSKMVNGFYSMMGDHSSKLKHNGSYVWVVELRTSSDTYAKTSAPDFPLGKHRWWLESPKTRGVEFLSVDACDDNTQFNCLADGTCVSIEQRQVKRFGLYPLNATLFFVQM